jgi:hypothetical protein
MLFVMNFLSTIQGIYLNPNTCCDNVLVKCMSVNKNALIMEIITIRDKDSLNK